MTGRQNAKENAGKQLKSHKEEAVLTEVMGKEYFSGPCRLLKHISREFERAVTGDEK